MATSLGFCAMGSPAALAVGNGIVHAQNFTGNPAHGGTLIASEWLQLGLAPGAETVRRETSDGIITTRTDVPCIEGVPSLGLCAELRQVTGPTFSRDRGAYLGDPNPSVSHQPSVLEDAVLLGGSRVRPAATGPLASVLESWQTAPPGHGSTYERYDIRAHHPNENNSEWIDAATHLPLKLTIRSGSFQQSDYWTYDPSLIDRAALAADFFLLAVPAHPEQYGQSVDYPGGRLPGSVSDGAGGARFAPRSLGPAPVIGGQRLCLDSASLYSFFETGGGNSPDAHIAEVGVGYVLRKRAARCVPGRGHASNVPVDISTVARKSADAAANRRSFQRVQVVRVKLGQRTLRVRIMPGHGQETLALVDIGASNVMIDSRLRLAHRPGAATAQILALVSRLRG